MGTTHTFEAIISNNNVLFESKWFVGMNTQLSSVFERRIITCQLSATSGGGC